MRLTANLQAILALGTTLLQGVQSAPAPSEVVATRSGDEPIPLLIPIIVNLDDGPDPDPNPAEKVLKFYTSANSTYSSSPPSDSDLPPGGTTPNPAAKLPALAKRWSWCGWGSSTYINRSTFSSPLVSDCSTLAGNIAGNGRWTLFGVGWYNLASYGTCRYRARADIWFDYIFIGNEDIRGTTLVAIAAFGFSNPVGFIGARGFMTCGGVTETEWEILRT